MNYTHLTFEQRYHIQLGWHKGLVAEVIARRIGVNRSTVYRELERGQDPDGGYNAHTYHHRHYMGKVEAIEFTNYEATLERFQQEWVAIAKSAGGRKS